MRVVIGGKKEGRREVSFTVNRKKKI